MQATNQSQTYSCPEALFTLIETVIGYRATPFEIHTLSVEDQKSFSQGECEFQMD